MIKKGLAVFTAIALAGGVAGGGGYYLSNQKDEAWENARIVIVDPGGPVIQRWAEYMEQDTNEDFRLRIEGVCASGCTFFLGNVNLDKVCYGDNAMLGFHGAFNPMTGEYGYDTTKFMLRHIYSTGVSQWLRERWDPEFQVDAPYDLDMIWTSPATFGVQHCDEVL